MRALVLLLLLGACAVGGYRDSDVPIASAALFDPTRFAGKWYEVARYPTRFEAGCTGTTATYTPRADGRIGVLNACRRNGQIRGIEGVAEIVGPGRLSVRLDGVPWPAPLWVLWVDEGYRTAVLGQPSGRSGWILNRDPEIPEDRLAAAREVLAFNCYDLARLETTPR
jgi:apolipoprotein D and lipocalin family protein